jgi:hypothetical protein
MIWWPYTVVRIWVVILDWNGALDICYWSLRAIQYSAMIVRWIGGQRLGMSSVTWVNWLSMRLLTQFEHRAQQDTQYIAWVNYRCMLSCRSTLGDELGRIVNFIVPFRTCLAAHCELCHVYLCDRHWLIFLCDMWEAWILKASLDQAIISLSVVQSM